jgi:integrase
MGRPRTVNARVKDLPRGFRKVDGKWYWRSTDAATRAIKNQLAELGISMPTTKQPEAARQWWEKHVGSRLLSMSPADSIAGSVEELVRRYEAEELIAFKRQETRLEYEGRIRRIRSSFSHRPYPRTQEEAMKSGYLSSPAIQSHLHANRHRAASANRDIQLLSRMFRLAKVRWGLTAYNPCEGIEYLPEYARDVYVEDQTYIKITDAATPILKTMADISVQTSARIGSVYTMKLGQIKDGGIDIIVGKKKNGKGYSVKTYEWTADLRKSIDDAMTIRKQRQTPLSGEALFLLENGKPFTKEAYKSQWARLRKRLGIKAREVTVHDLGRAKAISDAESDERGQDLAGHETPEITRKVYRRKRNPTVPMPNVKRGAPKQGQ